MLKLVKAELSYMKTEWLRSQLAYYLIGLFFLVIIGNITIGFITAADGKSFDYARYIISIINIALGFLPIVYIVMQLQLLIREGREKRCKLHCLLPLAIKEIGYARLLTPFVLLVALSLIGSFIPGIFSKLELSDFGLHIDDLHPLEFWVLIGIIPITYGLRLISEHTSKIIGLLFIGIIMLGSIHIGGGDEPEYIIPLFHDFVEYINNPVSFIVMTILFCLIIHLSFITRKSYLR